MEKEEKNGIKQKNRRLFTKGNLETLFIGASAAIFAGGIYEHDIYLIGIGTPGMAKVGYDFLRSVFRYYS